MSSAGGPPPYPGLRSFQRDETDLFFGREGSVDEMVDKLGATRFLAVLGASGSGKSSLVRTGLLDGLELEFLRNAGSNWAIADFRPGSAPLENLAKGLLRTIGRSDPDDREVRLLRGFLARGPRSIVEWCREGNLPEGANLLLLVDQFEELFSYSKYAQREEAEAFVALLLESARAPLEEARIYVAITMRSEYLGAAALIDGLAEAINRGLYLTPRMNRDQVRSAIVGPSKVCGFEIEPALVNRLLNDLTSFAPWEESDTGHQLERLVRRADQLPLMQHVLNRLWSLAAARDDGSAPVLKLADYEALGGLRGALTAHGQEILDELLPEHRDVAAAVFRALTAGVSLAEAVRRPTEFGELVSIAGGNELAVREVVEAFRGPGRNFLVPPRPAPLRPETVIDISHESLIRQWDQFADWLKQEIASAAAWRRLVDASERYNRGEMNLLSGLALSNLAGWWDAEQPTAAWAKRYGGDFDTASGFLQQSRQAEEAHKASEHQERRQKIRNRVITLAAVVILCIITPLTAWAINSAMRANDEAQAAMSARRLAEEQREAAEQARLNAESERQAADAARQQAEQERLRAEAEKQEAETARQDAEEQRQSAERARQEAEEQRVSAERAREEAEKQQLAAEQARAAAERSAEEAQQAQAEQQRAIEQVQLERIASRAESFQQNLFWESASNLLARLWTELFAAGGGYPDQWLLPQIQAAISRQATAEYGVYPGFLTYGGLEGWSGPSGRFKVYSTHRTGDETNKSISIFDLISGTVAGSFPLPEGADLGSEVDLVTPDARRASIVTDDNRLVLWSNGRPGPLVLPFPPSEDGELDVAQLAPVSPDERFLLYLQKDGAPYEARIVDPAAPDAPWTVSLREMGEAGATSEITSLQAVGLTAGRMFLWLNDTTGGPVVAFAVPSKAPQTVDLGGTINGAQLTPDGRILLALVCVGACEEQRIIAVDTQTLEPLWVETALKDMRFLESAARPGNVERPYSTALESNGQALLLWFGRDPGSLSRRDGRLHPWVGQKTFTGRGAFLTAEANTATSEGAGDAGDGQTAASEDLLTRYLIPEFRQKLALYVTPNSVAIHQSDKGTRIAGVSYSGDLLVYRRTGAAPFEEDAAFRSVQLGAWNCIAGIAFGGDGSSLLVRRVDGALRYLTAIGAGPGTDWEMPSGIPVQGQSTPFVAAAHSIDCSPYSPEAETTRIVPGDTAGKQFGILDAKQNLWWLRVSDRRSPADLDQQLDGDGTTEAEAALPWSSFNPMQLLRTRVTAVAADPVRDLIAILAPNALEIVSTADLTRSNRLSIRAAPKAGVFHHDGTLAVLFAGGRLEWFANEDGTFSSVRETSAPSPAAPHLVASDDRVGMLDGRDAIAMIDRSGQGSVLTYNRLPGDPSAVALLADGQALSIEYLTDSVSLYSFAGDADADSISDRARLLVMRSRMDRVEDSSIDALVLQRRMAATSPSDQQPAADCALAASLNFAQLEYSLLSNGLADLSRSEAGGCAVAEGNAGAVLAAIEALAADAATGDTRRLLPADRLQTIVTAAAGGDLLALRGLGAVLARAAGEKGDLDATAIAADAVRFGTSFPPDFLRAVAAGAPIPEHMIDHAKNRPSVDASAHQLLAHVEERSINDLQALERALFEFSLAERLYRESGRQAEADFANHRRVHLARILPDPVVLDVSERLEEWRPEAEPFASAAQGGVSERLMTGADSGALAALDRLAAAFPDSPLLAMLRTAMLRAEIMAAAATDPTAAAQRLLDLSAESDAWSPDLIADLLQVAESLRDAGTPDLAIDVVVEALNSIDEAFSAPIHAEPEAVDLFSRAASLFADLVGSAGAGAVAPQADALGLKLASYDYDTVPPTEAAAEVAGAEQVLDAASRLADALAQTGDAQRWTKLRGDSLFWRGVITNGHDSATAQQVLSQTVDLMRGLVEQAPGDHEARFRYAEALRWMGFIAPSDQAVADAEREGIRQYAALWEERSSLDPDLTFSAGVGYGFVLANLGQTIREMNLVDLQDGRTAQDHAGWVLEVLALAAEKDAVNDAMIEMGLSTADSEFVSGWYEMSSYGWSLGFLSGLVSADSEREEVTECDVLAADPYDPARRAPGVPIDLLDAATAEAACSTAHQADLKDARTTYQLARAISIDTNRSAEALELAREAAAEGIAAAHELVALNLEQNSDDRSGQAHLAASQRVIVESFPILYPFLQGRAATERDRTGLAWYAGKAAALGVPEAHMALADSAGDNATKQFHLLLASRLWDQMGEAAASGNARRRAEAIFVPAPDSDGVAVRVAEWRPEEMLDLPEDVNAM